MESERTQPVVLRDLVKQQLGHAQIVTAIIRWALRASIPLLHFDRRMVVDNSKAAALHNKGERLAFVRCVEHGLGEVGETWSRNILVSFS
jgi:hypothetical protein